MNFSQIISYKLTELIANELDFDDNKREIISYAIETMLLFALGTILLILVGYCFETLVPTLIAAFFGGSLRRVSGGAHFDTPLKCLGFGTVVYSLLGVLANKLVTYDLVNRYTLLFSLLVPFIIIIFLAPVDSEAKPIHSRSFKIKLKIFSMVFVILTFAFVSMVDNNLLSISAVLGVAYQGLTLLPIFNKRR